MTHKAGMILSANRSNNARSLPAFSLIEVLVSLVIMATLLTSVQWFGFFDRLRVSAPELAQMTQDRLLHAMLGQARSPRAPVVTVSPPPPCDDVTLSVLAGGIVVADQFECLGLRFETLSSGVVRYAPKT